MSRAAATRERGGLREPMSAGLHFAGAALSVAALAVLLVLARGRPLHTIGFAVYGASLVFLYLASAVSHSLHVKPPVQAWLSRLDYIAIFLLIAGTCAPLCLMTLRGSAWGGRLLAVEYGLAALGVAHVLLWRHAPHWPRVVLYVVMGWLVMLAFPTLRLLLPSDALAWLVGGGLVFTVGLVVLALDRPHLRPGRFSAHDLWHAFVLAGTACHFVFMVRFLALSA